MKLADTTLRIALFALAAVALPAVALAAPIDWMSYDEGVAEMKKKMKPGLIYFAGESGDPFTDRAESELFESKLFLTRLKKVVQVKVEGEAPEEILEKYEVSPGRGVIVLVDLLGTKVQRFSGELDTKVVNEAIVEAVEVTEERGKIFGKLQDLWEKGEKAHEKKKWAAAIQSYALILRIQEEKGEEVPSDIYEQADGKLSEIRADAEKLLDEAEALIEQKKYSQAKQQAKDIAKKYPDETVLDRAKAIEELVEAKLREQYKGK